MEIDGLPMKNGDFPWRTVSHNQMVVDISRYRTCFLAVTIWLFVTVRHGKIRHAIQFGKSSTV